MGLEFVPWMVVVLLPVSYVGTLFVARVSGKQRHALPFFCASAAEEPARVVAQVGFGASAALIIVLVVLDFLRASDFGRDPDGCATTGVAFGTLAAVFLALLAAFDVCLFPVTHNMFVSLNVGLTSAYMGMTLCTSSGEAQTAWRITTLVIFVTGTALSGISIFTFYVVNNRLRNNSPDRADADEEAGIQSPGMKQAHAYILGFSAICQYLSVAAITAFAASFISDFSTISLSA